MVFTRELYTKTWKVKTLGEESTKREDIVSIGSEKFSNVLGDMMVLGYRKESSCPEGIRYLHRSIEGLVLTKEKEKKIIKAEAWGESALSSVLDELKLPAYSSS